MFRKILILATCLSFSIFSSSALADPQDGNSATGPLVMCELPDGTMKYLPIVICQHSKQ
ncbi:hypothetical protein J4N42_03835 [Vibrio sp. SCSIO 43135]|uniref:Uncharacterized protein n=1 Tax=Vibrio paucivorans TaxID=2829489 RepID=A0A9X3CBJ5_9VIBR|nr:MULTISPECIES: hypothetical protein [Vibrio]MCW8332661.1 hypothetical protein [Vibrio paucivorans]USD42600.1 hypothetical protein J4N42_03835 [Vibrio sp. SCSIO 43135]